MTKKYTLNELRAFVRRADTLEKIETADAYIRKLDYLGFRQANELLLYLVRAKNDRLGIEDDLDEWDDDRGSYSPSCPWGAPGMKISDFITGVIY